MTIWDWVPAISTTTLVSALVWLSRNLILNRLQKSVQHEFDRKIEAVRSDFRKAEEEFKTELKGKADEIAILRSGAIGALSARLVTVEKRRLEAIDQLWAAFCEQGKAGLVTRMMSVFDFEKAAKKAQEDPKFRQFVEQLGMGFDFKQIDWKTAAFARPHVSEMAWAIYSAASAIYSDGIMRWISLKTGQGADVPIDRDKVEKMIVAALPHLHDWIKQQGPPGYVAVLEQLEAKLLVELRYLLKGGESDEVSIRQAAEILARVNDVHASMQPSPKVGDSGLSV